MKTHLLIPVLLAIAVPVQAESVEDKKFWKGQTDYVDRVLVDAEKRCGVKFTFEWVGKDKLRAEAERSKYTPNGICLNAINEVIAICRSDEDSKNAVKAKITGFQCGYANPRTLALKGGMLTYMGNNEQSNFSDWAKPWLTKRL